MIYDDEGKQIDNVYYTENRKIVKYEDMPEDLINSFVAIEDKTFWKHHGFNWTRMIGAVLSSLTGSGRISGTSTITQQLSRNVYLADIKSVRSIKRKLLEMYYASRLEHYLSKEEIIEAYLNTIYLGHGCYGVNAAARTYFSKSVKDLDLVECASLAALPQSPDTYALLKLASEAQDVVDSEVVATEPDTVVTNDLSRERRQLTLDLMLGQNLISKDDYDKVYDLTLNEFINPNLKSTNNIYSYFHEYLVDTIIADLMEQYGLEYDAAERMVYTKGLQIYSTVDTTAMKVIAKEFQDGSNFPYVSAPRDGNGNMLNNDGQIALYKYENFFDKKGNFKLSGDDGDVTVNDDGSITINADHKLHIYETEVDGATDYSLEFKSYFTYDDNDIMYSISGGYLNVPAAYKTADVMGNVVIDKAYFEDPYYEGAIKIKGNDVILTSKSYTLSPKQRQPQAAMAIVGVGTGEVKAMVGGRQFGGQKVLNRSLNPRQPGSSIKPLAVYGAALQKSYDLAAEGKKWQFTNFHIDKQGTKGWGDYITTHSSVEDERTKIEGKYWPNNFNNAFSGKNNFKTAIQKSINTCAVKIVLQVGSDYSIEQLKRFGLTTVQDDISNPVNDANPAALGLGAMTVGVEPLEMALAYASFPGGGKINTPICYTKVLDRNGEVLLEGKSEQSEALNEGVAWIMQEVLKSVVAYNRYMYVTDVEPGGKTGTTNDQYDIWFDGFTPSYAGSIWIGTDENVEMSSMSTPAAALWGKIINQIPNAKKGSYPKMPSNVIQKSGDYFTKGTETGLSSWSSKAQEKKERQEAYRKWLKARQNHKKKVIDVPGHYEKIHHPAVTHEEDDHDKPIYGTKEVDDTDNPILDEEGNVIGYKQKTVTDYDNIIGYKKKTVVDKEAWDEKGKWVDDVWHYEYEKGWRDGDFRWKGKSYNGG
jgi:penicillin-binding protein 1A